MTKTVTYTRGDVRAVVEYTYTGGLWYAEVDQTLMEILLRGNGYEA